MGDSKELISIIVPIYNTDCYLRQCLDSIINQSYKNFEVLLVNDGSVDDSAMICKEFAEKDSRIRYFEKENGGVSSARNLGLKNVKGNYITFVDSDDWVEENYLEVLYNALKENEVDISISAHNYFNMDDNLYYLPSYSEEQLHTLDIGKVSRDEFLELFPELSSLNHDFNCAVSKLFKVDLVKNLLFDESVNYGEDLDFFFNLYLNVSSIYYVNQPTYIYRQHQRSASNNCLESHVISEIRIYEKILKKITELHIPNNRYIEKFKMILYFRLSQFPDSQVLKSYESFISVMSDSVMYSQPLISIIVPIYNVENYLRMCLDSIEHQTYSNIEVLLINDGSPDLSGEICQEYVARDSRFRYFEKENGGLSDARNYGIDCASGRFLTFIDSDDWVEPTYVEDMYQAALNNNSEIVVSSYSQFDNKENHYLVHIWDDYYEKNYSNKKLMNSLPLLVRKDYSFLTSWGILFSRKLFNNVKFPKGKVIEDSRTNYKLFSKSKCTTYINKSLYMYRIGREGSIINTVNEKLLIDQLESELERLAIYTIKGWNYSDEKNNVLGCLRLRYQQAKENGLQDTEIFRRYTEILELIDNN
jgi:glycosyl transferase, family 2/glycosyl transferase family 8